MSPVITNVPPGFRSDGKYQAWFMPGITDPADVIVSAFALPTTVRVGCYFTEHPEPEANTETIEDDRACLAMPGESRGATTRTINDLTYIYDVQNPESVSNAAYAAMPEGAVGALVMRYGLDSGDDPAAGQFFDIYIVELGARRKLPLTRNTKGRVAQKPFVIAGGYTEDHELAAA